MNYSRIQVCKRKLIKKQLTSDYTSIWLKKKQTKHTTEYISLLKTYKCAVCTAFSYLLLQHPGIDWKTSRSPPERRTE